MTLDERERLHRFLAENVMGWVQGLDGRWYQDGVLARGSSWSPLNRLRDCELFLDKLERDGWRMNMRYDPSVKQWNVELDNFQHGYLTCIYEQHARLTDALCVAVARAYKRTS